MTITANEMRTTAKKFYADRKEKELKASLRKLISMHDKRYQCVITVERSYIANEKN